MKRAVVHRVDTESAAVDTVSSRLRSSGVEILDTQPNMLLVAGGRDDVARALEGLQGWRVTEETKVPPPRTRPQVLKQP